MTDFNDTQAPTEPAVYGVGEASLVGTWQDAVHEEVSRLGYATFESDLSEGQLEEIRRKLDEALAQQKADLYREGGVDLNATADADVVRAALACDPLFLDVATDQRLLSMARRLFGDSFVLLQQNGLVNRPDSAHYQRQWHRDLPYQHWVASAPIAAAFLLCVDEFNLETGGSFVLPASHRVPEFPSGGFVRKHEKSMDVRPGMFIVLDAMLFHRAGTNVSKNPRRAVNHLIGRPFMGQQIDLPALLGPKYASDPRLGRYLGYRWAAAPDVNTWRLNR